MRTFLLFFIIPFFFYPYLWMRVYIHASFVPGNSSESQQWGLSGCGHSFRLRGYYQKHKSTIRQSVRGWVTDNFNEQFFLIVVFACVISKQPQNTCFIEDTTGASKVVTYLNLYRNYSCYFISPQHLFSLSSLTPGCWLLWTSHQSFLPLLFGSVQSISPLLWEHARKSGSAPSLLWHRSGNWCIPQGDYSFVKQPCSLALALNQVSITPSTHPASLWPGVEMASHYS